MNRSPSGPPAAGHRGCASSLDRRPRCAVSRRQLTLTAVLALLLVGLSAALLHGGPVQRVDHAVRALVMAHVLPADALGVPRAAAVLLGQRGVTAPLLVAAALLASRRTGSWRPVVVALGGLFLLALTVQALKLGVGRTAPAAGVDAVRAGGLSFPSGHAAGAVLSYAYLGRLAAILRVVGGRTASAVAAVCAALAGVGVIAQDYHWASDVVAGWCLGGLLAVILVPLLAPPQAVAEQRARRGHTRGGSFSPLEGRTGHGADVTGPRRGE